MATLVELEAEARACVACPLASGRRSVVFADGSPSAELMIVGEAPGAEEDIAGIPFVGRSGKLLDRLLGEELGLDRSACYIANVVKCRPPANRDPHPDEVSACRHFLEGQIELVAPKVVVTLGNFASRTLLDTTEGITRLRGRVHRVGQMPVVPTYHPAAALRGGATVVAEMRADLVRARAFLGSGPGNPARSGAAGGSL